MPNIFEQIKNYNADLNLKNGKVKDPYENFRIRNSENSIAIGDSSFGKIAFDRELLEDGQVRSFVTAQSGGGKSYLVRNIIERFYEEKTGTLFIIDPEGEFYTLREKFDFVILGVEEEEYTKEGTKPDIFITSENLKSIVSLLVKYKINAILDLFEVEREDKQNLVSEFIEILLTKRSESPIQVFIDEASELARRGDPDKANIRCNRAFKSLSKTGRKRMISTFFITQRGTQLHKDIISECNTRLLGYTLEPRDLENYRDLLGYSKKEIIVLKTLRHEFMAYGSAFDHSNEYARPIKFKSLEIRSKHLKHPNKNKYPISEPNSERVKRWIGILKQVNKFDELKERLENKNFELEKEELEKPIIIKEEKEEPKLVETSDLEKIIARFGTISFVDLSILLRLPYYNKIQISKMISDLNSKFINIENEEANYFGDEEFKFKFSSKPIVEYWKEQAKKIAPLIQYLYDNGNDDNYVRDLKNKFLVEEYENLIRIIGERVYLNPILMFDKENTVYNSAWNGEFEEDLEDDFFNDEEDDD